MRRQPVTLIILAWNEWNATRACLDSLRSTLDPADQVIVVDNGSVDQTPEGLPRYPWIQVVTNEENRGFAAGCNQGAALAEHDVVVFLNNDTVPVGHWLDALVEPFADATIGATGSRSNFVSGPQLVADVAYAAPRHADIRRFERNWRKQHQGEVTDVDRLVGFCLAVRREAFEAIGGFDEGFGIGGFEDDDLCLRLLRAGHRLVIAHASFVHHDGHKTFDANGVDWYAVQQENAERYSAKHGAGPVLSSDEGAGPLLSACLIVRDEEERLPACLRSLDGVVDEIVVYDTGSADRSMDIARSAGATVIEGYWDDDFARARNAALDACTGTWILHVDADEELVIDDDLRAEVRHSTSDALIVTINNVDSEGQTTFSHAATRLFRRTRGRWTGRLHEFVVSVDGDRDLCMEATTTARLRHWGYTTEAFEAGGKHQRNIRIGRAAVDATEERDGRSLLNLARALAGAGNSPEALRTFEKALHQPLSDVDRRLALRSVVAQLIDMEHPESALDRLPELRTMALDSSIVDYLEALARAATGDLRGALSLILPLTAVRDGDGYEIPRQTLLISQGELSAQAARWDDSMRHLTEAAVLDPVSVPWALVATACFEAESSAEAIAALVEDGLLLEVVGQLQRARPEAADMLLESLWSRFPRDPRLLAGAINVAPSLDVERAMEWSGRLRASGLDHDCPLLAIARDPSREGEERLRAAAVVAGAFDVGEALDVLPLLAPSIRQEAFPGALQELDTLAPALLPTFVELIASTPARCSTLSRVLFEFGAEDEAALIADLGRTLEDADVPDEQRHNPVTVDGSTEAAPPGVFVLGMHRSGTSATSRVLNLLGLRCAAEDDLMPPAGQNAKGFWESTSLSSFNDGILSHLGGSWSAPPSPPDGWELAPAIRQLAPQAVGTFEASHGRDGKWVWKDPRTSLTFPFWASVLPVRPIVVLPYRNPLEVWQSLERRDGFTKAHALALWERYVRSALESATGRPTLVASYEELLDDPDAWCRRAADFLAEHGVTVDVAAAGPAVRDFLEQELRHETATDADVDADADVTPAQRALWARLRGLDGSYGSFDPGSLPHESFWVEPLMDARRGAPHRSPAVVQVTEPATSAVSADKRQDVIPRCSIIIPLFNKVDYTRNCLETLIECTDDAQYELVLVDNGSTDGTETLLRQLEGDVVIVRNEQNKGFACASNQGARAARGEHLLFLNNDTEARPGWLAPLLDALDADPGAGAVGSRLLFPEGTLQHAGVVVAEDTRPDHPALAAIHRLHRAPADHPDAMQAGPASALTAACLLVRRRAFFSAGGFDEAYWNGYEDVDLCFKLRENGWRLIYEPASCLVHHESVSGPERFSKTDDNVDLLVARWAGRVPADVIIGTNNVGTVVEGAAQRPIRSLDSAKTA